MADTATLEPPVTNLSVSAGDMFGNVLDQARTLTVDDAPDNDVQDAPTDKQEITETQKPVENKQPAKPETKLENKQEPSQKPDAKADKEKRRVANLDPETREFLLASEVRKAELIESKNNRIKELEAELNPAKQKVGELEKLAQTLPEEKKQLQAEVEALRKEKQELTHKVTAHDVYSSDEYIKGVKEPWDRNILGTNDPDKEPSGIAGLGIAPEQEATLLQIVQRGNKVNLNAFLGEISDEIVRDEVRQIYKEGKALLAKHAEYAAKGPQALEEINSRKSKAEAEALERVKTERNSHYDKITEGAKKFFPFLGGEDGNEPLNKELQKAKEAAMSFDYGSLSSMEQANVAHQLFYNPIIRHIQDLTIKEQTQKLKDREEEIVSKDAEIAKLNERLGNVNGTKVTAGSGKPRGDDGKFVANKDMSAGDLFETITRKAGY